MTRLSIPTARVFQPLLKPARYKGVKGGRGSGKSMFCAGLLVEEMIADKTIDAVCLRETQKSLEFSVKREIEAQIQAMNAGSYFDVMDKRIVGKAGNIVIFEGLQNHTAESIKSLSKFKRAWVEEAQALSHRSLDILRPTIREDGSELWFSWNPKAATDAVEQFFASPPEGSVLVEANWQDNPWFPQVLRDEMLHDQKHADPAKYAHIWLGKYLQAGDALVFKNWRVEEFDSDPTATFRYGADWGFAIDPSVLVRCYLVGRRLYVDYEAYEVGREIDRLPDLFMTVPGAEKWPITADSARPETINYMQRHGFPRMHAAVKGPGSVDEGIQWLQSLEIVVHPRCRHTIDELSTYAYERDKLTDKPIPKFEDKNNHVIDAIRYACEGARRAAKASNKHSNVIPLPSVMPMASR